MRPPTSTTTRPAGSLGFGSFRGGCSGRGIGFGEQASRSSRGPTVGWGISCLAEPVELSSRVLNILLCFISESTGMASQCNLWSLQQAQQFSSSTATAVLEDPRG